MPIQQNGRALARPLGLFTELDETFVPLNVGGEDVISRSDPVEIHKAILRIYSYVIARTGRIVDDLRRSRLIIERKQLNRLNKMNERRFWLAAQDKPVNTNLEIFNHHRSFSQFLENGVGRQQVKVPALSSRLTRPGLDGRPQLL
jgi:hypothetical protein